jgi:hypothetical protein
MVFALIVLVLPLSGCIDGGNGVEEEKLTINLSMPFVEPRDPGSGTVWDATLDIYKVTPRGTEPKWTSLTMIIKGASGSVLLQATPLSKDSGLYGSAVEVWYVDEVGDASTADEGDAFKVTSMDETYEGAHIEVLHRGDRVADIVLPTDFP